MEKVIDRLLDLGVSVGSKLLYTIVILLVGLKLIKWAIKSTIIGLVTLFLFNVI